jgi:hypothetical protein
MLEAEINKFFMNGLGVNALILLITIHKPVAGVRFHCSSLNCQIEETEQRLQKKNGYEKKFATLVFLPLRGEMKNPLDKFALCYGRLRVK